MKDKKGIVWQIKLCDFKMDVIKWQLNFRRVELFWAEIILVISNRTRSLWKHTYDFRPICTPLSSITIIYYIDTSVLLENIPLVKFIKTTSGTRVVYFRKMFGNVRLVFGTILENLRKSSDGGRKSSENHHKRRH